MIHLKKQDASFLLARLNPYLSRAICCTSIWYTRRPLSPSLSLSCEVNASNAALAKLHVNINCSAVVTKGFAINGNADESALIASSKDSSCRFSQVCPSWFPNSSLLTSAFCWEAQCCRLRDTPRSSFSGNSPVLSWSPELSTMVERCPSSHFSQEDRTSLASQWQGVESKAIPCRRPLPTFDTGTRRITADSLKQSSWVNGPSFLKTSDWPFNPNREVTDKIRPDGPVYDLNEGLEVSSNFPCTAVLTDFAFPWEEYSSFTKIKRLVAYMLRLSPKHRHFRSPDKAIIDPAELVISEEKLLQLSQLESFPAESKQLAAGKYVKTSSRISSYSPFFGPNDLIRSTGRIQRLSATASETRHSIILDSRLRLIRLFLRFYHLKHEHQSVDYLRSVIHQQFVVLRLRSALRAIETYCACCRKRKAKTVTPMMTDLPAERLGYRQSPFSNCGVDYFGPFHVTIWLLLLCIKNLNAEAPLSLVHKGIKWKYNPPSAPHPGGAWERMVRSCKRVFYAILG